MKYKHKIQIPSSEKEVEYDIAKCIKCGCDKIKLEEYEDGYGYISNATCTKCKFNLKVQTNILGIINEWNKKNDIPTLISNKLKLISDTANEVNELKGIEIKKEIKLKVDEIIGMNQPWPLRDVLNKLIEASEILLHDKSYDGHGWEEIHYAVVRAKEIVSLF